jgi:hypothetical protein
MQEGGRLLVINAGSSSLKFKASATWGGAQPADPALFFAVHRLATAPGTSLKGLRAVTQRHCIVYIAILQLFSTAPLAAGLGGLIERIGDAANSTLSAKLQLPNGRTEKWADRTPITNHTAALEKLMRFLSDHVSDSIESEVRCCRATDAVSRAGDVCAAAQRRKSDACRMQ